MSLRDFKPPYLDQYPKVYWKAATGSPYLEWVEIAGDPPAGLRFVFIDTYGKYTSGHLMWSPETTDRAFRLGRYEVATLTGDQFDMLYEISQHADK